MGKNKGSYLLFLLKGMYYLSLCILYYGENGVGTRVNTVHEKYIVLLHWLELMFPSDSNLAGF